MRSEFAIPKRMMKDVDGDVSKEGIEWLWNAAPAVVSGSGWLSLFVKQVCTREPEIAVTVKRNEFIGRPISN